MKIIKPNFWKHNNLTTLLLLPLTLITRLIVFLNSKKISYKPKIKSICVGNIYLGGTGKTELVMKLNDILKSKFKCFVIKKDYKNQIDEQILLAKNTRLILDKNRIEGICKIRKSKDSVAIFDDGLQDKSIDYKLSIVCFNSFSGVGNGQILPAGPLRESLSNLKNYESAFINGPKNLKLTKLIKFYNKKIKIFTGRYYIKNKKDFNLRSNYLAFCGIGTPENFFSLLRENKIEVVEKLIFPDHFDYKSSDIEKIKKIAKEKKLKIITTEKDIVKFNKFKNIKLKFTKIGLIINEEKLFRQFLKNYL